MFLSLVYNTVRQYDICEFRSLCTNSEVPVRDGWIESDSYLSNPAQIDRGDGLIYHLCVYAV